MKYLDDTGLARLVKNMREAFSPLTHTHGEATAEEAGFMSASDKAVVDGCAKLYLEYEDDGDTSYLTLVDEEG